MNGNLLEQLEVIAMKKIIVHQTELNEHIQKFVGELSEKYFYSGALSEGKIKEIWSEINKSADVRDFVLDCTAELRIVSGMTKKQWDDELQRIGELATFNPGVVGGRTVTKTVLDKTFIEEVEPPHLAGELMVANPWFYTLWLLSMSGTFMKVAAAMVKPGRRTAGTKDQ